MRYWLALIPACLLTFASAQPGRAQDEIIAISFDSIPTDTQINGGGASIDLQGDTEVAGTVTATGEIRSDQGFRFPDSTVQTTAASGAGAGSSANLGLYSNRIADVTPPEAYIEICFKNGALQFDIHAISEPTTGGFCVPGDLGYLIERNERTTADWTQAKATCLLQGMRLPEAFEFQYGCDNSSLLGLIGMDDGSEWISNAAQPLVSGSGNAGVASSIMGNGSCTHASWGWVGRSNGQRQSYPFRCAL